MSADALPITPARFAAALKDLPVSTLHLKVLELRNSIAHLDYSNEQLRPFAEGTATALSPSSSSTSPSATQQQSESQTTQQQTNEQVAVAAPAAEPDQDCLDAIRENERVIERMQERIRLVRAEVENRGLSWTEFQSEAEREAERAAEQAKADAELNAAGAGAASGSGVAGNASAERMVNGVVNGDDVSSSAGRGGGDGASGGERHSAWTDGTFQTGVIRGGVVHMDGVAGSRQGQGQGQGGSLSDEELRRRMEEQLRGLGGEDDDDEGGLHL